MTRGRGNASILVDSNNQSFVVRGAYPRAGRLAVVDATTECNHVSAFYKARGIRRRALKAYRAGIFSRELYLPRSFALGTMAGREEDCCDARSLQQKNTCARMLVVAT